jgi:hypothetical protein
MLRVARRAASCRTPGRLLARTRARETLLPLVAEAAVAQAAASPRAPDCGPGAAGELSSSSRAPANAADPRAGPRHSAGLLPSSLSRRCCKLWPAISQGISSLELRPRLPLKASDPSGREGRERTPTKSSAPASSPIPPALRARSSERPSPAPGSRARPWTRSRTTSSCRGTPARRCGAPPDLEAGDGAADRARSPGGWARRAGVYPALARGLPGRKRGAKPAVRARCSAPCQRGSRCRGLGADLPVELLLVLRAGTRACQGAPRGAKPAARARCSAPCQRGGRRRGSGAGFPARPMPARC